MDDMREVFRSFSQIEGFEGWVIGKLCFQYRQWDNETKRKQVSVRKHKENYALLEAAASDVLVQMHILKPQEEILEKKVKDGRNTHLEFSKQREQERKFVLSQQHILLCTKSYAREEILAFVDDVGDYNGIHRTDKPVVPGGLIAEWLWEEGLLRDREEVLSEEGRTEEKAFAVDIRFQDPVYAGDEIAVYRDGISGKLYGVALVMDELVLKFSCKKYIIEMSQN